MTWYGDIDWADGQVVRAAQYRKYFVHNPDHLKGSQSGQTVIDLVESDVEHRSDALVVADTQSSFAYTYRKASALSQPSVVLVGEKTSPLASGDSVSLRGKLRETTGGTTQTLVEVMGKIDVTATTKSDLFVYLIEGGARAANPILQIKGSDGNVGIDCAAASPPGYVLDVDGGDVNADSFDGFLHWDTISAGNVSHDGEAEITGQFISTSTAPTVPFALTTTTQVNSLNGDLLSGEDWPTTGLYNAPPGGTALTANDPTLHTVASVTTTRTGIHEIITEFTIPVDATHSGAVFTLVIPGTLRNPTVSSNTSGDVIQVVGHSYYFAASSTVLSLQAMKSAGGASSITVHGSIMADWVAP